MYRLNLTLNNYLIVSMVEFILALILAASTVKPEDQDMPKADHLVILHPVFFDQPITKELQNFLSIHKLLTNQRMS